MATLATSVSAATWGYSREAEVGSLLSITHTNGSMPARFTAPTRNVGYQLPSYDIGGTGSRTVTHDAAGRMVGDGAVAYGWDDFSSLVSVKTSGSLTEALQYDGLGRLVAKWNTSGVVDEYVWDGEQMVAALDTAGARQWTAYWGAGIDNLVSVATATKEYLAVHDGRGSVAGYYSATTSHLAVSADYTPEGRVTWRSFNSSGGLTGDCDEVGNSATCALPLGLPFGYPALKSAATGLLYFRNRWYSTTAGQWLSQDPLGPVDSPNLYAFNGFDAVNYIDPWGLDDRNMSEPQTDPKREHEFGPQYVYETPRPEFDEDAAATMGCALGVTCKERLQGGKEPREAGAELPAGVPNQFTSRPGHRDPVEYLHDGMAVLFGAMSQAACSMNPFCSSMPMPDGEEMERHIVPYQIGRIVGGVGAAVVGGIEVIVGVIGGAAGSGLELGSGVGALGIPATVTAARAFVVHGAATLVKGASDAGKVAGDLVAEMSSKGKGKAPKNAEPAAGGQRMFGSQGTQMTSKTIWKGKDGMRIDVENPNPGQRRGQIHFQQGNDKFLYDPASGTFVGAPNAVNDLVRTSELQDAIAKGLRFLGEGT